MSKEEKIARIDALREKKRRILKAKPTYKPNPGQLEVHQDTRRIRFCAAGNGGGKTCLGTQEAIWAATGYNPILDTVTKVPATIAVILDNPDKVKDLWMPEISKWFLMDEVEQIKNGKPYVNELVFKNGSVIKFYFHQQQEMVFEGIEIDYAIFDEPPPRHIFIGLMRGARKKGAKPKFLFIGTPLGQPWLYSEIWQPAEKGERDDIGIHRFSTEVNAHNLAEGYIEEFSKNLSPEERRARLMGEFAHLEGLALAHLFSEESHVVRPFPWPNGKPVVIAIDPHQAKPHTAIMLGAVGDGRLYYIKELQSRNAPEAFARELRDWYQGYKVVDIICDSFGNIAGTGGDGNMSFTDKLIQMGVRLRTTDFKDKSDEDFIARIKQVLEIPDKPDNFGRVAPRLAIFDDNPGIVRDIEGCQWQKRRKEEGFKEKLEISNRDFLACLKYALTTSIVFLADGGQMPGIKRSGRSPWSGGKAFSGRK